MLLAHLEEVDQRRAYAIDAYSSLFDYVVRGLGYAEGQAAERVSAMRLMREVPEVKIHLEAGALTLTSAAMIQRHLRAEKAGSSRTVQGGTRQIEQSELIQKCLGQSKRCVEKILISRASDHVLVATQKRTRQVSETLTEVKILFDEETRQLLNRAKELSQNQTTAELLKQTLKIFIEQREKQMGNGGVRQAEPNDAKSLPPVATPTRPDVQPTLSNDPYSRFIPVQMKRAIFARSNGQCEYVAPHYHPLSIASASADRPSHPTRSRRQNRAEKPSSLVSCTQPKGCADGGASYEKITGPFDSIRIDLSNLFGTRSARHFSGISQVRAHP